MRSEENQERHAIRRITISHKNSFQTAFPPRRLPFHAAHTPLRSILQFVTGENNRQEKRHSDVIKKKGTISRIFENHVVIGPRTIAGCGIDFGVLLYHLYERQNRFLIGC